ncbi:hypothetical protein SAY86_017716 [Trapa natans]|uniref:Transmembrane protein n=1 Tax=Trapa natans TaxID=22666 RepID=A0AAN7R5B3_TRANT|nr:hypothetical protein SAY86_017716 [Trapa natans]
MKGLTNPSMVLIPCFLYSNSLHSSVRTEKYAALLSPHTYSAPSLYKWRLTVNGELHNRDTQGGRGLEIQGHIRRLQMADWGPVVVAVIMFVLLSPGLLFQLPAKGKLVEFGNMQTSGASILVHGTIFFCLITMFLIAIGVHVHSG